MLGDEMLIAMWHLQNVFRNAVMKKFSQIVISIYRYDYQNCTFMFYKL